MAKSKQATNSSKNGSHIDEKTPNLTVRKVKAHPEEIWKMMMRFSGPTDAEKNAMRATVDTLFQRGYELVVAVYDHLQRVPETAEILGWQDGADDAHLAERRRFFTLWLSRTLSMDFGTQFGDYLFYAGKVHAAHGPRQIETPSMWITGSVGLIVGAFATFINEADHSTEETALALSSWNKYLLIQLNQMHTGYEAGMQLGDGEHEIELKAYAMVRHKWGRDQLTVHFRSGDTVEHILSKVLNFAPELRAIMFEPQWDEVEHERDLWMRVERNYALIPGWRVQLNGKNLNFHGGFDQTVHPGDNITLFSPGR